MDLGIKDLYYKQGETPNSIDGEEEEEGLDQEELYRMRKYKSLQMA